MVSCRVGGYLIKLGGQGRECEVRCQHFVVLHFVKWCHWAPTYKGKRLICQFPLSKYANHNLFSVFGHNYCQFV